MTMLNQKKTIIIAAAGGLLSITMGAAPAYAAPGMVASLALRIGA